MSLLKIPDAPNPGAVKVTLTPGTPLLRESRTTAERGWTNVVLVVADCGVPEFTLKLVATPCPTSTRLWLLRPEMAATPVAPGTTPGVLLPVVVPFPNSRLSLSPQAQTVPSLFTARLKRSPAAMAVTPVSPVTWTGV